MENPLYLFYKKFELNGLINNGDNVNLNIFATAQDGTNYRMNLDHMENYMSPTEIINWWKIEGGSLNRLNVIICDRYDDNFIGNVILERKSRS